MVFMNFADIDEECSKHNQLKREDIAKLIEWQIMQPHLPSPMHPMQTVCFLHASSYSIEAAKQRIDTYYTFRTHCRKLATNLDPFGAELQLGMKTLLVTPLPDVTPEGYMVLYGHCLNCNADVYNCNTMMKMIDIITILTILQRGCQSGVVGIINMKGVTMAHLLKWNATSVKIGVTYLHRIAPIRFKSIHFVNCGRLMDNFLALFEALLSKALSGKLFFHSGDNATIFKFVPHNMLPIECGGESFCAEEYFRNVVWKNVELHSEFLKRVEEELVDETKRPVKKEFDVDFFGVEGTFKQLNID